ncbi:hypothetical protein HE1_00545 [Holospora elegans E1]|uniref:DDE Tnp4 domain-containing protein n=1 Tax=Holospora elegans E1 TaxID=1427503 RepID=A0A023DY67_9PROT|nr:hypothetical protein HE1_00545 [Holospora elegans E1]
MMHSEVKVITEISRDTKDTSQIRITKNKKPPLTPGDKQNNQELASKRSSNENIIGMIKRFKIVADKLFNDCSLLFPPNSDFFPGR